MYDHYEWLSKVLKMFWGFFVCLFYALVGLEIVPKVLNILGNYANTKLPPRPSCVNLLSILTLRQSFSKFTRLVLNSLCSSNRS